MTLKINTTREDVKAYEKQKFEVIDESWKVAWKATFTTTQMDVLKENMTRIIEDGKDYEPAFYEEIHKKMREFLPKTEPFTPDMLQNYPEAVKTVAKELFMILQLNEINPKQKTLEMPKTEE